MRFLALLLFISSCAPAYLTLKDFNYEQENTDQAHRDSAGCRMEASKTSDTNVRYNNIYGACMESKGYKRKS